MGNDWADGRKSNNLSNTRFTNDSLLHANTSTAMASLLTPPRSDDELVTFVTALSVTDRLDICDSEIELGSEKASNLAAEKGSGSGCTQNTRDFHILA